MLLLIPGAISNSNAVIRQEFRKLRFQMIDDNMNRLEFVSNLEQLGIRYEVEHSHGASYITIADHFGYRFNAEGNLDGGFIWPPVKDFWAEWDEWRLYLRRISQDD